MNLEDTVLNETSQSQRDKYCMIPLIHGAYWSSQTQEQNVEWWWGEGKWGVTV